MDLLRRHEGHHEVKTDRYWAFGYYFESLDDKQKHQLVSNGDKLSAGGQRGTASASDVADARC